MTALMCGIVLAGCARRRPTEPAAVGPPATHELKGGKLVPVAKPVRGTAAGELEMIRRHVESGRFEEAVEATEDFLQKFPADEDAREEAMMLAGEAELGRGRRFDAYEWFERLLAEKPRGKYSERALNREYDIGDAFLKGAKRRAMGFMRVSARDEGLEILAKIAEHAPRSAIARKAIMRVADYHRDNENHAEAVDAYDEFLTLFPKAPRAPQAMRQAAEASLATYLGPDYDETPLLEARQRFIEYRQAYPALAEQEKVGEKLEAVDAKLAEKFYVTGFYYERTGRTPARRRAAIFYYRKVAEDHPRTRWADQAALALARLGAAAAPAERELRTPGTKEGRTER